MRDGAQVQKGWAGRETCRAQEAGAFYIKMHFERRLTKDRTAFQKRLTEERKL
jgi:hypothetical protein